MTSELTTAGLPSGRTIEEAITRAVARRERIWGGADWADVSEDEKLEALEVYCTSIYSGDKVMGRLLASVAIYST